MPVTIKGEQITVLRTGAAYDYLLASFTRDGTWRDLDLSSILPADTTKFWCRAIARADTASGKVFGLRENGRTGDSDSHFVVTAVAAKDTYADLGPIGVDGNRKCEYYATNESGFAWGNLSLVITAYE